MFEGKGDSEWQERVKLVAQCLTYNFIMEH